MEMWDLPNQRRLASVDGILAKEFLFTPDQSALLIVLYGGGLQRVALNGTSQQPDLAAPAAAAMRTWTNNT